MVSSKDIAIIAVCIVGIFGIIVVADYVQVTRAAQQNRLLCVKGTFFEGNSDVCRLQEAIVKYLPWLGLFG